MCPMNPRLLRPIASGSFDPRTIGTMLAWYDFSDTSSLTLVNGFVSEIRNKSGTAPTLSQATEADRPSLGTLGGRQAGVFDGSNDYLFSSTAVQGFGTMFAAVARGGNNQAIAGFGTNIGATVLQFVIGTGNSSRQQSFGRSSVAGGVNTQTFNNLDPSTYVLAATFTQTAAPSVRTNGQTASGAAGSSIGSNQSYAAIGARNVNNVYGAFWNSTVGEVLYYNFTLSTAQIEAVEQYLSRKWGITF
jgi:hypothetical protein